ncbi:hypothetical protein C8Q74DRAFT_814565 [Fomes fomentarius]|nr:hypothetical protein C8Q74DRAFT_814565 [Fomes fomentarius]
MTGMQRECVAVYHGSVFPVEPVSYHSYSNLCTVVTAGGKTYPMLKGFQIGQLTQPKQFTRAEYNKARSFTKRPLLGPDAATSKELDIFYQLGYDPLKECQNSSLMSHFVTSMGKIKGRNETKLTWKNQRRIGKAIRRAKMMGIIPVLSRRDLLRDDMNRMAG